MEERTLGPTHKTLTNGDSGSPVVAAAFVADRAPLASSCSRNLLTADTSTPTAHRD